MENIQHIPHYTLEQLPQVSCGRRQHGASKYPAIFLTPFLWISLKSLPFNHPANRQRSHALTIPAEYISRCLANSSTLTQCLNCAGTNPTSTEEIFMTWTLLMASHKRTRVTAAERTAELHKAKLTPEVFLTTSIGTSFQRCKGKVERLSSHFFYNRK